VLSAASVGPALPAHAAGQVSVANGSGQAVADPTYATSLTVKGRGFQSIRGGHGGIYVFFGTVKGTWQPSKGGKTGVNYFYVPDGESAANQGFQRFVAFPGSDTSSSANGGTIAANGTWSTTLTVPGAAFTAADREGNARQVDCRKERCGVITIGAHGVSNATNESFTPVTFKSLYTAAPSSTPTAAATTTAPSANVPASPTAASTQTADAPSPISEPSAPAAVAPAGPATLEVDRASAKPGHAMPFTASGLAPGQQVSAVLDDGVAAVGPLVVGAGGQLSGVLSLPADLSGGTHELRLFGVEDGPLVRFAVIASDEVEPVAQTAPADASTSWGGPVFAGVAVLLLAGVVALRLIRGRGRLV
jgi:hypothetical protein